MLSDYFSGDFKIVRDSVHGYIRIPSCFMREIVDTNLFQRLRHIEQTSMRPLFPAARHDRFIHSLGVFHLGCKAFDSVYRNAVADGVSKALPECGEAWWEKHHVLFALACLLHDCAHAAFSHTYEVYYEIQKVDTSTIDWKSFGSGDFPAGKLPEQLSRLDVEILQEYSGDRRFVWDFIGDNANVPGAPHERMSALMVGRYFGDRIARIFDELNRCRSKADEDSIVLEEDDLSLIARMIIGCPYEHDLEPVLELKNCFISLLNSSTVDVDGLDYMMRDTHNSGISNRSVDYERLLDSIRICEATRFADARVDDVNLEGVWLQGSKISLDDKCRSGAEAKLTGQLNCMFHNREDYENLVTRIHPDERSSKKLAYSIEDDRASLDLENMRSGCKVLLSESCRVKLTSWQGVLDGVICKPMVDLADSSLLSEGSKSFVLAYGKASISVLQAAIDARNTFYQWVYSHPHVVYHSGFLQNYLLKMSAKYLCCMSGNEGGLMSDSGINIVLQENKERKLAGNCGGEPLPPRRCRDGCPVPDKEEPLGEESAIAEILGLEGFFNPDDYGPKTIERNFFQFWRSSDDDLNSLFKWVYLNNKKRGDLMNEDIDEFFGEYFSRPQHHAIWKSYGDRQLVIRKYPSMAIPEFEDLRGTEQSLSSKNYVFIDEEDECLSELRQDGYNSLIAVNAKMSLKSLNYARLLISYPNSVERLVDMVDSSVVFKVSDPMMFVFAVEDGPADDAGDIDT